MKQEKTLLFDGDVRGYRTGKDCLLELYNHKLWKDSIQFTPEEIEIVENESEAYLDIIDYFIDNAKSLEHEGTTWILEWYEGSIFAVPEGYHDDQPFDDMDGKLVTFIMPNWTLCALFNNDESGLEPDDIEKLNAFIDKQLLKYNCFHAVDVREEVGFVHRNDLDSLGSDCSKVIFDTGGTK